MLFNQMGVALTRGSKQPPAQTIDGGGGGIGNSPISRDFCIGIFGSRIVASVPGYFAKYAVIFSSSFSIN